MQATIIFGIAVVLSYLLGSIPNGLILARLKGVNIRQCGSGNIGATNVFRSVSKVLGLTTFALDFLKGLIPTIVFAEAAVRLTSQDPGCMFPIYCGCAAIAGHVWPIYLRFKGGKGVATSAGALIGIAPAAVGFGFAVWLISFLATRYVSLGSLAAAIAMAISGWLLYGKEGLSRPVTLTILAALVVLRHRANIVRLVQGKENRFGKSS